MAVHELIDDSSILCECHTGERFAAGAGSSEIIKINGTNVADS
jgi:hypothetical protein